MFPRHFLLLYLILLSGKGLAQENLTLFFEPEINLNYKVASNYAHKFSVENRNFLYRDETYTYEVKHLEFAHTSTYSLSETKNISVGIQYRFEDSFEKTEENEFRFLQSFEWLANTDNFKIKQQVRNEQRFYTSTTKYRLRYELGIEFPLQNSTSTETYLITETESLFEVAKTQKPEFEQRVTGLYKWQLNPNSSFEIGLQYRLADYTQNLTHELFLVTGIDIQL